LIGEQISCRGRRIIFLFSLGFFSTHLTIFLLPSHDTHLAHPSPPQQYVTKASSTLRAALKEPAKSKAMAQETFSYNRSVWSNGEQGAKKLTDSLAAVGK